MNECGDCNNQKLLLQRSTQNSKPGVRNSDGVPSIVHEVLRSPGHPLDDETRAFMEPRFGHKFSQVAVHPMNAAPDGWRIGPAADSYEQEADQVADTVLGEPKPAAAAPSAFDFSQVRVHADARAAQSAQAVGALAYTLGRDIVFGSGQYAPHTSEGRKLLAHELAHTIQQSGSAPAPAARLQRTIGDGHDLQAARFAGDPDLEACFDNEKLLRFGSRGEAVKKIQQALIDAGFPLPEFGVDGIFESETQGAVQRYQRAHGLSPDGIVGPITMGELDAQFAGGAPAPGSAPTQPAQPVPTPGPTPTQPAPPGPAPAPTGESITSETVATAPGARTRTDVGVGEKIDLTHTPGSATWSKTAGTLDRTNGDKVRLTAPDIAQKVTVTAGAATLDFNVVAPNDVHMDLLNTNIKHQVGHADSGIATQPFLLPDNVNFNNVSYHELNTGAVVSNPGAYSCLSGFGHCKRKAGGVCPELFMTDNVVAKKGTEGVSFDCVYSGDCQQTAPFRPGAITISIPYEYQVGNLGFHKFATVDQVSTLEADASTLTSAKAGAKGTTTVAAGTVTLTECPDNPFGP
jgi:peptidoglycan hydrolase-like protein with peptidoglycan-binding domain